MPPPMQRQFQADPAAGQPGMDAEAGEAGEAGTELCIAIADDGTLTAYKEVNGQPEGQPKPCADIAEALKAVLMLYKEMGGSMSDESAAFDGGFGPKPTPPSPATPQTARGMA